MIIVSDTTPLRYLVEIEFIDILPRLFDSICTSPKVLEELRHPVAPAIVRSWAANIPNWLQVKSPAKQIIFERQLDVGEAEALSLAYELQPSRLLTDDRAGCHEAERLGIRPLRTLPVIWIAAELKLLDLDDALNRLEKTSFRATQSMYDRYRQRNVELREKLHQEVIDVQDRIQSTEDGNRGPT